MTKIVIDRPPQPIPVLPRTARKWRRREEWGTEPAGLAPEPTSGDPDSFVAKIMELLRVKQ